MSIPPPHCALESLHVLGSGGFFPAHGRQTMCFLVRRAARGALLLDAGTGVGRLAEPSLRALLDDSPCLDIVLSHYHLDHVVGLAYLGAVWQRPIRLWAPGNPLVDAEPLETLQRLISPPLFPVALADFPHPIEVVPYRSDFEVDGLPVRVRRQRHPGGSVGLRFGNQLAYVTDTAAEDAIADFVRDTDLLVQEVWCTAEEAEREVSLLRGHCSAPQALDIAIKAGVSRFLPVHHHPRRSPAELAELLATMSSPQGERPCVVGALDRQKVMLQRG